MPLLTAGADTIIVEPRCEISGRALELAAELNIYIFITSAGGLKLYSWFPPPAAFRNIDKQVQCLADPVRAGAVARHMVRGRFGREFHPAHPVSVLRGYEGSQVKQIYRRLAREHGIEWPGRQLNGRWDELDPLNRCISMCNAALYSVAEIAILRAGFTPWLGIIHDRLANGGKSFVYDIADLVKFEQITPVAFRHAASEKSHPEWRARAECGRLFRTTEFINELTRLTTEAISVGTNYIPGNAPHRSGKNLSGCLAGHRPSQRKR
ncbi:CRISPR-associated endonuclease Cas1 [Salmonella enterica subsp. enterica serovar Choleraesuis]|nr:CRISPR-associated endonuclease Cas1 [Salmonella enterica subsp. enterica serovar Choleraesuis]